MINNIVYDLSLSKSTFNKDAGGIWRYRIIDLGSPWFFKLNFQLPPSQASQRLVDARKRETSEVCERGMMGTSAERKQGMMGRKKRETAARVSG